jgi:hypothetical protein
MKCISECGLHGTENQYSFKTQFIFATTGSASTRSSLCPMSPASQWQRKLSLACSITTRSSRNMRLGLCECQLLASLLGRALLTSSSDKAASTCSQHVDASLAAKPLISDAVPKQLNLCFKERGRGVISGNSDRNSAALT